MSSIGQSCHIVTGRDEEPIEAEVVGFRGNRVLLMPLGEVRGIGPGSRLVYESHHPAVSVSPEMLGRVLDGCGRPLDGRGPLPTGQMYPLYRPTINPFHRDRITRPLDLGIRAINSLLTCGSGQKVGIFAGSGVGKSVLLGMICRHTEADVNVIALIGERGREVKEFIEKDLGPEGLARSVIVAATSDQPPLVRLRGAFLATAIAEYFRDQGKQVVLMMDSVTRLAHAQREVGLAIGEPPTSKGYPPSVFTLLPKVLERVASAQGGTMTGLYTVLVEGDDMSDPIADSVRSILDGHIVLTRELAAKGHFPAIDILQSVSRVMPDIVTPEHMESARYLKELMAIYGEAEDLINLGAYRTGANPRIDLAMQWIEPIRAFLRQQVDESGDLAKSLQGLQAMVEEARRRQQPMKESVA
jgi:flagellum-specific ATP synthase